MRSQDTITLTGSTTGETPVGDVTIPRELGSVRLLREIGRGGMGVVYLGRHQMLDRDVAVKFLLNAVAGPDDPDFAGFIEGARAAARLEHPGLTTIHHADVVDGIPYLVMQYVDGPALSDVLKQTGSLSLFVSFAVLDAVSEAIGELHDRGIIHRDIKPGNVMLDLDGRVVVTDFGLALARPIGQRGLSSARLGGTPAYMAPEMFTGEVSLQSDVYALGIMAFALVTGELPYTGTIEEVCEKHLHEPLPLEPLQRHGLDHAMIEVLERATRKNAMFRYKTARHFRSALKPAIITDELLRKGAAELQTLVPRALETKPEATTTRAAETTPPSTYFDRLAEIAEEKRSTRKPASKADVEGSAPEDRDQRRLTDDLLCVRCGYNLRGLPVDTRCPECGTPTDRSLRGDLLAAADPAWLSSVYRGLIFTMVAGMGGVAAGMVSFFKGFYEGTETWGYRSLVSALNTIEPYADHVWMWSPVLLLLGVVGLTRLDPRLALNVQPIGLRRVARVGAAAAILVLPLSYALSHLTGYALVTVGGEWAFRSVFVGCLFSTALYLARLAARIPDPTLAVKTRSFGRRFAVCAAIVLIDEPVGKLCGWTPGGGPWGGEVVPFVIGMILASWIYYSLRLMRLAFTYAGVLKRCLVEARKRDRAQEQGDGRDGPGDDQAVQRRSSGPSGATASREPTDASLSRTLNTLVADVPCFGCEYNLRGLPATGKCPECAEALASSLRPDRLLFADRRWLTRIARGLTLILTTMTATPVVFVCIITLGAFVSLGSPGPVFGALMFVGLPLALLFLALGAVFCSTAPEPRRSRRRFERTSRQAVRAFALLLAFVSILITAIGVTVWTIPSDELAGAFGGAMEFIGAGAAEVCLVLAFAPLSGLAVSLLLHLTTLADRIPDRRLARRSRDLALLAGAVVTLGVAALVAGLVLRSVARTDSASFEAILLFIPVCVVGAAVTSVFIWFLIRFYRKTFKRVITASVSYETLFGNVPTEVALPTCENDRAPMRSPRAQTGNIRSQSTDVDEESSSDDISCIHCGYNLRGLPEGGRCPECGTAIARSSCGNLLSAADPAWLQRVYRGQALVCAGCVALVTYWFLFNATGSRGSLILVHALGASSVVEAVSEAVLSAAAALLLLLGAFTTTTLDPRLSLTEQPIALRRFVRGSMVALVALAGSSYLVPTVLKQLGVDTDVAGLCRTLLLCASGLAFLSSLVGICYYLAGLAMRIPDARLATRSRSKVVRFAGCIGIIMLMVVWAALTQGSGASAGGSVSLAGQRVVVSGMFLVLLFILGLVALGYIVSLMMLMSAYRKAFRKCLLEAQKRATAQERSSEIIRPSGDGFGTNEGHASDPP